MRQFFKKNSKKIESKLKHPKGPKGRPVLGNLLQARQDPLNFALNLSRNYGPVSRFRIGFYRGYFLNHPDYFEHVLKSNQRNYSKKNYNYKKLKAVLGEGLITSEGDHWLRQRRLIQPVFQRRRIAEFASTTTDATLEMLQQWDMDKVKEHPLDMAQEMMRLTLKIITTSLFGADVSSDHEIIAEAFMTLNRDIAQRFQTFFSPPLWLNTRRNRQFKKARSDLNAVVYNIINQRRKAADHKRDLLGMLLAAGDVKSGEKISDRDLRDEVMTLLLAGHETTANLLTWTLYLLSQNPQVMQKVRSEIKRVIKDRVPSANDISDLHYTNMILQESLRLFPPVWIISRKAMANDTIGGYAIPAGTIVTMCSYTLHRHPAFWEEPELFKPERFSPEINKKIKAFYPFGAGPRSCVGAHFAMMEAHLILAILIKHYNFKTLAEPPVEPAPLITLQPRYGLKMSLQSVIK